MWRAPAFFHAKRWLHVGHTRVAYLGPPPLRYSEVHGIVDDAVEAALEVDPSGARRSVTSTRAARVVIERAGYGGRFTHCTGNGIRLTGHEPPLIMHTNDIPFEAGMAFSVEPGVYLVGEFGVRLEEIVVVTERGADVLSRLGREVRVLET